MKRIFSAFILSTIAFGCTSGVKNEAQREPASQAAAPVTVEQEAPSFKYFTYKNGLASEVDVISADRWASFRDGGRTSFLSKFYYATTNQKSNRGLNHAVCFTGSAHAMRDSFLNPARPENRVRFLLNGKTVPESAASDDGMLLGVRMETGGEKSAKGEYIFRISQCSSNKGVIGSDTLKPSSKVASIVDEKVLPAPPTTKMKRAPASHAKGFLLEDQPLPGEAAKVPITFDFVGDYDRIKIRPTDRPWQGMDLRTPEAAYRFALLMQKYAYEGMFQNANAKSDLNLIARNNKMRDWCHMPWQNVGEKGREWVHGMTKEFDLKPSPTMDLYKTEIPGANWGVAYYNSYACPTIQKVFGTAGAPNPAPNFKDHAAFPDGTVIVKFLFTTALVPGTENAFTWTSHVSGPGSSLRSLAPVRHVQMDISIRDSSLKGVRAENNDWVFLSYYFDPKFDPSQEVSDLLRIRNPVLDIANLPPGFLKMRPQGMVTDFDAPTKAVGADAAFAEFVGPSVIFKNAQTNDVENRMNGPVDNPKGTCLGCHGAAGTSVKSIPGFRAFADWDAVRGSSHLDFNQQMSKAKQNYQTDLSR